ncbi:MULTISPECIES: TraB/GumN family protein [unclassified Janthinobacterium]|uniref:TraB/GumN family protein n=1 Tax=unclassified Janthinobacterium TaxID=2610881 RepID=UPI0016099411|nr:MULTISPECIES: TraB/GumN family protein [unclassified Janthinobacterium]MBB5368379.1 uncharacterized protein YbaP (TraB family) [Janthinobacterium sp. K2C7]MBB5382085.1 uncharacterized protein YbaP (TraB family) [Janthinobacterium sp. K2Li3]MBB5386761.1 uncharacterized protein YbaP (TraB family) [Janthinobacterium sp. K2E3]
MLQCLLPALCLSLAVSSAWAQTDTAAVASEPEVVAAGEQILVVGQRPGPGLWKVSKDNHVLWIFGTYSPLPQKMEWRSQQVETILAQSQEYLTAPSAKASVGFFRGLTLLPSLIGLKKNPDGATLHDVLPADVYARWQPLKEKYLGDDDSIERERPIFAADTLFEAGLKQAGLSKGYEVNRKIDKMVEQHKLKVVQTGIELPMDDPSKLLKDFKKSQLADAQCFSKTLARLESDIDAMRLRANAWAKGDLQGIQKLDYADQENECSNAMSNGEFARNQPGFQNIKERMQTAWLAAAEKALASNASSFASLRLADILDPHGYLASLKAKGYRVEDPDGEVY